MPSFRSCVGNRDGPNQTPPIKRSLASIRLCARETHRTVRLHRPASKFAGRTDRCGWVGMTERGRRDRGRTSSWRSAGDGPVRSLVRQAKERCMKEAIEGIAGLGLVCSRSRSQSVRCSRRQDPTIVDATIEDASQAAEKHGPRRAFRRAGLDQGW